MTHFYQHIPYYVCLGAQSDIQHFMQFILDYPTSIGKGGFSCQLMINYSDGHDECDAFQVAKPVCLHHSH